MTNASLQCKGARTHFAQTDAIQSTIQHHFMCQGSGQPFTRHWTLHYSWYWCTRVLSGEKRDWSPKPQKVQCSSVQCYWLERYSHWSLNNNFTQKKTVIWFSLFHNSCNVPLKIYFVSEYVGFTIRYAICEVWMRIIIYINAFIVDKRKVFQCTSELGC